MKQLHVFTCITIWTFKWPRSFLNNTNECRFTSETTTATWTNPLPKKKKKERKKMSSMSAEQHTRPQAYPWHKWPSLFFPFFLSPPPPSPFLICFSFIFLSIQKVKCGSFNGLVILEGKKSTSRQDGTLDSDCAKHSSKTLADNCLGLHCSISDVQGRLCLLTFCFRPITSIKRNAPHSKWLWMMGNVS